MYNKSYLILKKEYLNLKGSDFKDWYDGLNKDEKLIFNSILSDMKDKLFNNKK